MKRRAADRHYWTATGVIPRWQLLAVYGLIFAAGFIGFLSLRDAVDKANSAADQAKAASRSNRALALSAKRRAAETKRLTVIIQNQRHDVCVDQNERRRTTIVKLDMLIEKLPPVERTQARANRNANVQLINALAPRRNCAAITP